MKRLRLMGHCSTGIREISYSPELRLSQLCQSKYFISVVHLLWKRNKLKGQRTLHTYLRTGEYLRSKLLQLRLLVYRGNAEKRLGGSKKSLLLGREAAELGESDELVIENRNANNASNKTQDDIIFPN